ncbi:MAG TPA: septal ring lytic transglycosylase RlpA family protein [Firmicutes bacterium]|jgi:rare lipoprotein A|nr:septal ring lytic transglycosylase RlpA family protein [Bacillota bacterium]
MRDFRRVILPLFLLLLFLSGMASARAPIVGHRQTIVQGRAVSEVTVNEQVVLRLRAAAGGVDAPCRAQLVASRLHKAIAAGWCEQLHPGMRNGQIVVLAGEEPIVTIDESTALLNHCTPVQLAWQWCRNLAGALGQTSLPSAVAFDIPGQGLYTVYGKASWYGPGFERSRTASGEPFNARDLTAAHRTLPFGTRVLVTNLVTGDQVIVRINDRGPWVAGRIIDLSEQAARELGLVGRGVGNVRLDYLVKGF